MKVLITCLSYNSRTGSELYFYELAHALHNAGCDVTIAPLKSGDLVKHTHADIKIIQHIHVETQYDMIVFSHAVATYDIIKHIKCKKIINVIHSEVIQRWEDPVLGHDDITYVTIRPAIQKFIKQQYGINSHLIYNPFNLDIYNEINCKKVDRLNEKIVLYPGTLNYLRIKPLLRLLDMSLEQNFKVIHVGNLDRINVPTHVNLEHNRETNDMVSYYKQCDIVAGILLGRTSIEGLLSGKKVFQFDVNTQGDIIKNYWYKHETSLDVFDRNFVAKQILEL